VWQVVIGMDVAASEFFSEKDKTYDLNFKEEVRIATSYYAFIFIFTYRFSYSLCVNSLRL
jgi:enolase